VLAMVSRHRELSFTINRSLPVGISTKDCFDATPKPTRETRALPEAAALAAPAIKFFARSCRSCVKLLDASDGAAHAKI